MQLILNQLTVGSNPSISTERNPMLDQETIEKALLETMQKYKDFPVTKGTLLDIRKEIVATLVELHPDNGKMMEKEVSQALEAISGINLN